MKALVCELCGSNSMVKKDGFFVCEYCGTKYSLEEARKMMVEIDGTVNVKGTVSIDNSAQVKNYLSILETAFQSRDIENIIKYCDKILEIDPNNCEAWVYRAKSACWNSSLQDPKFSQSYTAAKRALDLAPVEKRGKIAEEIFWEVKKTIVVLLNNAQKMPSLYASQWVHNVMLMWKEALVNIPYLSKNILTQQIQECREFCQTSKGAFMPQKRTVYASYIAYNNRESYDKTFEKALSEILNN